MDHTVAYFCAGAVYAMLDRMALGVAVRFHAKGAGAESRHYMGMDMRSCVRRDGYPVLLGHMGDTQRLREPSMPGGIELHEANGARRDEIADGEAGPFSFPMCQRDRDSV